MSSRELFLTGGTGLVGSHVAALFREEGWSVRALVRPASDTRHLERLGCQLVLGDVRRPDTLSGAAQGCRAAVHAAALVAAPAPWERYRSVNVEGTRNVVAECLRAGCGRLVHVSSVAVYGHPGRRPDLPLDEGSALDTPLRGRDHYERSKRMAEDVVRRACGDALEWTILRPAVVMGERDRHLTPRILGLVGSAVLPIPGDGDHPLPVVYAGNVAEACRLAAVREIAAGRIYNVADDGHLSLRSLLAEAREGRRLLALPVPSRVVDALGRLVDVVAELVPGSGAATVTGRRLWFATHPNPFRSRRAREELGWSPRVSPPEGWRRSLAWHRRGGVPV